MSNKLITLILIFFTQYLSAQTASLKGKITSNNESIAYASITLKGTPFSTTADTLGVYQLSSVPPGEYDLSVHMIGLKPAKQSVILVKNQTTITVELLKQILENTSKNKKQTVLDAIKKISLNNSKILKTNQINDCSPR